MNQSEEEQNNRKELAGDSERLSDQDLRLSLFLWITGMRGMHRTAWPEDFQYEHEII